MWLWFGQIILTVSLLYLIVALVATQRFFRRPMGCEGKQPAVSVLKPMRGANHSLKTALQSVCEQCYPEYQIVLGVASPEDEASAVANELCGEYPRQDLMVVTESSSLPATDGTNGKVKLLCAMFPHAKHDILVISDSDMLFDPNYLKAVTTPFADPKTGLVTCLYRSIGGQGLAAALEAYCINLNFLPSVMVARCLGDISFAFGATMAITREALQKIGGLEGLKNYLADDYLMGNRVYHAGYRVFLSNYLIGSQNHIQSFRDYFWHQLRWARTYRICRPWGYFFSIITHAFSLSLLFACLCHNLGLGLAWISATLAVRLGMTVSLMLMGIHGKEYLKYLPALPLSDLLTTVIWAAAFTGNTVVWNNTRFRVRKDGLMIPLSSS